jgi:hypothetical protein
MLMILKWIDLIRRIIVARFGLFDGLPTTKKREMWQGSRSRWISSRPMSNSVHHSVYGRSASTMVCILRDFCASVFPFLQVLP